MQAEEPATGTVNVFARNENGGAIAGIRLSLTSETEGNFAIQEGYTSTAGTYSFASVPPGTYYITAFDPQGTYLQANQTPSGDAKPLLPNQSISFDVVMKRSVAGTISLIVKDSATNEPVQNVNVRLKKSASEPVLGTTKTGSDGKATINVSENVSYYIELDHPEYILKSLSNVKPSDQTIEVKLQKATETNSGSLSVSIVDSTGQPVDNVKATLKRNDGSPAGKPLVTGSNGTVSFARIEPGTYFVEAVKAGFEPKNSSPITIEARQPAQTQITLDIGFGDILVKVLDGQGQPLPDAAVKAIDLETGATLEESQTDSAGEATASVRLDKKPFISVEAENYLKYNTVPIKPLAGVTVQKTVTMVKSVPALQANVAGIFTLDNESSESNIVPGQRYIAKVQLLVPKGSGYSEAGLHVRTGKSIAGRQNIMEEDSILISGVETAGTTVRGTSYTPPKGEATDAGKITTGDAKWANVVWRNAESGVYEANVELLVSSTAAQGDLLEFWYRGYGVRGSIIRDPVDKELGESLNSAEKLALYANAKQKVLSVGPTNLCNQSFCKTLFMEDLAEKSKVQVIDSYSAKLSTEYEFSFTVSSISRQTYANSGMVISGEGLELGDYSITDAFGQAFTGTAQSDIENGIGTLQQDSVVSGKVRFSTKSEGDNAIILIIKSSDNAEILRETIIVNVPEAKTLNIDVLPKQLVPFIDNQLLVKVSGEDNAPIENAVVGVASNGKTIAIGQTDRNGTIDALLPSPNANDKITITAQKQGYRPAQTELTVSGQLLRISPPEIKQELNLTKMPSAEPTVLVENFTKIPLEVEDIQFSAGLSQYLIVKPGKDYKKTLFLPDQDSNISISIELADAAYGLTKNTVVSGAMSIYLANKDLGKRWVQAVPIEVRISLGKTVDSATCLAVDPNSWKISTAGEQKTLTVTVTNNCKVEQQAIDLKNVSAKVSWENQDEIGTFRLDAESPTGYTEQEGFGRISIPLDEKFQTVFANMQKNSAVEIKLAFQPNEKISSASASPKIILRASNPTENGTEQIYSVLSVDAGISNLAKCVKVQPTQLQIIASPPNLGYGIYQGYGYNPNAYSGALGAGYGYQSGAGYQTPYPASQYAYGYNTFSTTSASSPNATGAYGGTQAYSPYPVGAYPSSMYGGAFYGGTPVNQAFSNSFNYGINPFGSDRFRITNNCGNDVEIKLEADAEIQVPESSFVVSKDDSKDLKVQAGYTFGRFNIEVKARNAETEDRFVKVQDVEIFTRPQGDISAQARDCLKLMPPNKIDFSGFFGTPVKVQIINYCYDMGIRVPTDESALSFICDVPSEATTGQATQTQTNKQTGQQEAVQQPDEGKCPLVSQIYFIDEARKMGPNNRTTQELQFEIKPDISYRKQAILMLKGQTFRQLGQLRLFLQTGFYRIEVRADAKVTFFDQLGSERTESYFRVLEDKFAAGEFLDALEEPGSDEKNFQNCINKDALNTKQYYINLGHSLGVIPQEEFDKGNGKVFQFTPEKRNQVLIIKDAQHPNGCGTIDRLSDIRPLTWRDSKTGLALSFAITDDKHNITMFIDRSGLKTLCADVEKPVQAKLTRVQVPETQGVGLPAIVRVLHESVQPEDITEEFFETCATTPVEGKPTGEETPTPTPPGGGLLAKKDYFACSQQIEGAHTGDAYYTEAYFNRLLFDWSFGAVKKNVCDVPKKVGTETWNTGAGQNFCDAVQNMVSLTKKQKEIEKAIGSLQKNGCIGETSGICLQTNTKNLFRFSVRQRPVTDNAVSPAKKLVFFVGSGGTILESRSRLPAEVSDAKSQLDKLDPPTVGNALTYLGIMETLIREIEKNAPERKDNIVAEIETIGLTEEDNAILESVLKADKPPAKFPTYVATFNEFKAFHQKIREKVGNAATIAQVTVDGKNIDYRFLQRLLKNISFRIGIRNNEKISEEDRLWLMQFSDLWKLYYENIDTETNLIADGYSQGLVDDFASEYAAETTGMNVKPAGSRWNFKTLSAEGIELPNTNIETGRHGQFINYDWTARTVTVELTKLQSIEEIDTSSGKFAANNLLLRLPFDGKLGGNRRTGYGTSVKGAGSPIRLVFNSADSLVNVFSGSGGLKSLKGRLGSAFADTKDGVLIDISSTDFKFNPSVDTELQLEVVPEKGKGKAFYELFDGTQEVESENLLTWFGGRKPVADAVTQDVSQYCSNASGSAKNHSIETDNSTPILTSFVFVPWNKEFLFRLYCAAAQATAAGTADNSLATIGKEYQFTNPRQIRVNEKGQAEDASIKAVIDKIASGEACVVQATKTRLKIAWNKTLPERAQIEETQTAANTQAGTQTGAQQPAGSSAPKTTPPATGGTTAPAAPK